MVSITIPAQVESLKSRTLADCLKLKSITLGESVSALSPNLLYGCFKLEELILRSATPPTCKENIFGIPSGERFYNQTALKVPDQALDAYREHEFWGNFKSINNQTELSKPAISDRIVSLSGNTIRIHSNQEQSMKIYDITGKKLYDGYDREYRLSSRGIYIVVVSGRSHKIAF